MSATMIFEHLYIVLLSVLFTVVIGLPLGVLAYMKKSVRSVVLWAVDILQTIPALALLGICLLYTSPSPRDRG